MNITEIMPLLKMLYLRYWITHKTTQWWIYWMHQRSCQWISHLTNVFWTRMQRRGGLQGSSPHRSAVWYSVSGQVSTMQTAWIYWRQRGAGIVLQFGCQVFSSAKNNGNPFFLENALRSPLHFAEPLTLAGTKPAGYTAPIFFCSLTFLLGLANWKFFKIPFFLPAVTCFPEGKGLVFCQPNKCLNQ